MSFWISEVDFFVSCFFTPSILLIWPPLCRKFWSRMCHNFQFQLLLIVRPALMTCVRSLVRLFLSNSPSYILSSFVGASFDLTSQVFTLDPMANIYDLSLILKLNSFNPKAEFKPPKNTMHSTYQITKGVDPSQLLLPFDLNIGH